MLSEAVLISGDGAKVSEVNEAKVSDVKEAISELTIGVEEAKALGSVLNRFSPVSSNLKTTFSGPIA